jgi:hypothetical protein
MPIAMKITRSRLAIRYPRTVSSRFVAGPILPGKIATMMTRLWKNDGKKIVQFPEI